MVVTAIKSAEIKNINNNIEFGRKRDDKNSKQTTAPTGLSDGAKAVPVVVLLAMSPMNATPQTAQMLEQLNDKNTVEMYSQLPQIDAPNALEIAQVPQKPAYNPPPRKADGTLLAPNVSKPERYINSEKFQGLDGKNYYIIYNNAPKGYDPFEPEYPEDEVYYVYIVPETYSNNRKGTLPPRVKAFINHNNEFIGVGLEEEKYNNGWFYKEVRLPEDVLGKIMDIMLDIDNPPYKYNGKIKLIRTESTEMEQNWEY